MGDIDGYDLKLIHSRVLVLQQTPNIDLAHILKHELAPVATSMFKDNEDMRIATTKSGLKNNLQVVVSHG